MGAGFVKFRLHLAQRYELLDFLCRQKRLTACQMQLHSDILNVPRRPDGCYTQFQYFENAFVGLLAVRMAAEAFLDENQSLGTLLLAIFGVEIPTKWRDIEVQLSRVKMYLDIGGIKLTFITESAALEDSVLAAVDVLDVGGALVINCNRSSIRQNEPFDVAVFIKLAATRLLVLVVDCHSAQFEGSKAPDGKPGAMSAKLKTLAESLQKAGFSDLVKVTVVGSSALSAQASADESVDDCIQLTLGLKELQRMMPPWSPWIFRRGGSCFEALTQQ